MFPKLRAGFEVVAADFAGGGGDDLGFAVVFDDERGGPGGAFFARLFPEGLAGAFVEGGDEVFGFVIPNDDEGVAVKDGGTAFAEGVPQPTRTPTRPRSPTAPGSAILKPHPPELPPPSDQTPSDFAR